MKAPAPKPPAEKPPKASRHCRHYSYEGGMRGGPRCALGVNLSEPGAPVVCIPNPVRVCEKRKEWSLAEREAWKAFVDGSLARAETILAQIPVFDRRTAKTHVGRFECPVCGGSVIWKRALSNGHLEAACSTPHCFSMVQ